MRVGVGESPRSPWVIDQSYQGNMPSSYDFFMELCTENDLEPGPPLPPHCRAVRKRKAFFAYVALASEDGYVS
jgi:hypothetical protein